MFGTLLVAASGDFFTQVVQAKEFFLKNNLQGALSLAIVLCSICCVMYFSKLAVMLLRGNEVTAWDALRPVVCLFAVCNFNSLVLGPIDFMFNKAIIEPSLSVLNTQSIVKRNLRNVIIAADEAAFDDTASAIYDYKREDSDGVGFFQFLQQRRERSNEIGNWILQLTGVDHLVNIARIGAIELCEAIFDFIFVLMKNIIFVLSEVQLAILAIIGPFVFAIDILPGLSGIATWIARYIQISFWKVTVAIVALLQTSMVDFCLQSSSLQTRSIEFVCMTISLACIVALFSVEKISSYVVQSNGANGATGGFYKGLAVVARKMVTKV